MRRRLPLALLASALIAAGCGGSGDESPGGGGGGEGTQTPSGTDGGGASSDGRTLFASTCGSCHALATAETSGTFGPNLDELQPDKERVLNAIASGPGAMPENLLQGAAAETVAEFVASSAGG